MPGVTHGVAAGNEFQGIELRVSVNHTSPSHSEQVAYRQGPRGASPSAAQGAPPFPPDVDAGDVPVRGTFGYVDVLTVTSSLGFLTTAFALKQNHAPKQKVDAVEFAGGLIGLGWAIMKLIPWSRWPPPSAVATPSDIESQPLQAHNDGSGFGAPYVTEG